MNSVTKAANNLSTTPKSDVGTIIGGFLGSIFILGLPEIIDALGRNRFRFSMNMKDGSIDLGPDCSGYMES